MWQYYHGGSQEIRDQFQQVKKGNISMHDSEITSIQANGLAQQGKSHSFAHSVILWEYLVLLATSAVYAMHYYCIWTLEFIVIIQPDSQEAKA